MKRIISTLLVILLVVQVCFFQRNYVSAAGTLGVPSITSPDDGSELDKGTITVRWSSVSGADYYLFAALDTTTGTKFINSVKVTGTRYSISSSYFTEGHNYKVAVGAYKNNGDASNWATSYFSINKSRKALEAPVIVQPGSGTIIDKNSDSMRVSWTPVSGAGYYISVRKAGASTSVFNYNNQEIRNTYIDVPSSCLEYGQSYIVFVTALSQGRTATSSTVSFTVKPQAVVVPDQSITISGIVRNKYTGAPIPYVKIMLNNDPNWVKTTDDNGYFIFNGVANGTHNLTAVRDKFVFVNGSNEQIARIPVTISNKSAEVQTVYMIDVNGKYEIYGTLRDTNNRLIAGALIYPDSAASKEVFGVRTKADGSYRIMGVSNGYHTLNVDLEGYIPIENKGVAVSNRNVKQDLVMLSKRIIDGYVTESNFFGELINTRIKDAKVWLDKGGDMWTQVTGSSGTFSFNGVSSENHYLSASAAGYESKNNVVIDLRSGNRTYVFALTKLENIPKDKEAVLAANKNGLLTAAVKASYTSRITRAEFAELVGVLLPKLGGQNSDISKVPNYALYRYDNTSITRQEMALMLYSAITIIVPGELGKDYKLPFTDLNGAAAELRTAAAFLGSNGIMLGEGNSAFSPSGYVTKEQAVVTIERAYEKVKKISDEYSAKEQKFTAKVKELKSQNFLHKETYYKQYTKEVAQKAVDGPLFRIADDLSSLSFSTIYSNITEPAYSSAEEVFIDYSKERNSFYIYHAASETDLSMYSDGKKFLTFIKATYDIMPALKTTLSNNDILELKKLLLSDDLRLYNQGANIKKLTEKYSKFFEGSPNQGLLSTFKALYQNKNISQTKMLEESRTMLNMHLPDKAKSSLFGKVFNSIDVACTTLDMAIEVCALVSVQEKAVEDLKELKNYIKDAVLISKIDSAVTKLDNEFVEVLKKTIVNKSLDYAGSKLVGFSLKKLSSGGVATSVMTGLQIGSFLSNVSMNADTVLNKDKCIVTNLMVQNEIVKSLETEFNNIKTKGNSLDKIKFVKKGLIGFSTFNDLGTKYAYELLEAHDSGVLQNVAMFFGGNYNMDKQRSKNYIELMKSDYKAMQNNTRLVYEAY